MAWGDGFKAAWAKATAAGQVAATSLAIGTQTLRRGVVRAVDSGIHQTMHAAQWAGRRTQEAAEASKQLAVWGARTPVRGFVHGKLADWLVNAGDSVGKHVAKPVLKTFRTAAEEIGRRFGKNPVGQPTMPCGGGPLSDKALDGALMTFEDGRCGPVNGAKGAVTSSEIQQAKNSGYQSQSETCRARRQCVSPPRTILFVNGVRSPWEDHCKVLKAIGDSTCATVIGIYNATEGAFTDVLQTAKDRALIDQANKGRIPPVHDGRNPAVDSLSDYLVSEIQAGNAPEIWAHSQGGAVASLALCEACNSLKALPGSGKDPLSSVKIRSFGSAAPKWPDGPQYEHYVHVNDATPVYLGLGENHSCDQDLAGAGASVIRFSGSPGGKNFDTAKPTCKLVPDFTRNHGMEDTYLRMCSQQHNGAP